VFQTRIIHIQVLSKLKSVDIAIFY